LASDFTVRAYVSRQGRLHADRSAARLGVRTQIGIVGAGPAGMFLALLLRSLGIECIVVEQRDRAYIEGRARAGVLEQNTVELMRRLGAGGRVAREGLVHRGTNLAIDGRLIHVDFAALTAGKTVTVYGQQEVMRDLYDAAEQRSIPILWNAEGVGLSGLEGERPAISFRRGADAARIACDYVAGCDGFHGVSRTSIPASVLKVFERVYAFGWLGILADVPPAAPELIYANHERGFALASMRSLTRSRYYIQCAQDEDPGQWPDERFCDEVCLRLGPEVGARVTRGPSFEKSVAPLRSFVCEPMRWKRLFLAGDAAHIVPPTGAKGVNLAVADVSILSAAFAKYYSEGSLQGIDNYSRRALERVWKAERFSWWFTSITHRFPDMDEFARRLQIAELDYLESSRAAQQVLAENYVGLPLEDA
jgi:p-hydroxybenzoate 3-monooxygenase